MNTLVTGGTGLIGNAIARRLIERGHSVRALVRDPARAKPLLDARVELMRGDIEQPASLEAAMQDIAWVFHAAGMPEQWQRDDGIFARVNTVGTANVMRAALAAGVRRVIYTSTMDVFAAPAGGTLVEGNIDPELKHTAYERSKQAAEKEVEKFRAQGLDVVYVNPSAVYGPSPVHIAANALFLQLLNGQMPMVPPGGMSLVYVDGVADAHIAAAERGQNGERYLLADAHATNSELIAKIAREAGLAKAPPDAPPWLIKTLAAVSAPLARVFGFKPLIAPGQLAFLLWNVKVDASKAQRELGFTPLPLDEGIRRTLAFLREQGLVPG